MAMGHQNSHLAHTFTMTHLEAVAIRQIDGRMLERLYMYDMSDVATKSQIYIRQECKSSLAICHREYSKRAPRECSEYPQPELWNVGIAKLSCNNFETFLYWLTEHPMYWSLCDRFGKLWYMLDESKSQTLESYYNWSQFAMAFKRT